MAAATTSNSHRPPANTSRSTPDSSAAAPPAMSRSTGASNGPQNAIAAAETRYTTKATGMIATNQRPCWAATMSVIRRLCAPNAAVMIANMCGSSYARPCATNR